METGLVKIGMETELIKMSNELVRSRFFPKTVYEMRILMQFAKRIDVKDEQFTEYSFHKDTVFAGENLRGGETNRLLNESTDHVMGKVITRKSGSSWKKCNLFFEIEFDSKTGVIKGSLHPSVKDLFIGVRDHFLLVNESEFNSLRSIYSQKIFLYAESFKSMGRANFTVSDLHDFLNVPKSYRSNFSDFKKRVLDVIKDEINNKTSLNLEIIEDSKGGKRIKEVIFVTGGVAKAVENTLKQRDLQKEADQNNKIFLKVMACYNKKLGICKEELGQKYCVFCRQNNPIQLELPIYD